MPGEFRGRCFPGFPAVRSISTLGRFDKTHRRHPCRLNQAGRPLLPSSTFSPSLPPSRSPPLPRAPPCNCAGIGSPLDSLPCPPLGARPISRALLRKPTPFSPPPRSLPASPATTSPTRHPSLAGSRRVWYVPLYPPSGPPPVEEPAPGDPPRDFRWSLISTDLLQPQPCMPHIHH